MSILTLAYKADKYGNCSTPRTGQPWPGSLWARDITGKSVICGLQMFEANREALKAASIVTVMTYDSKRTHAKAVDIERFYTFKEARSALTGAKNNGTKEIICVGGKLTIEAVAHYASKIVAIDVAKKIRDLQESDRPVWLPSFIRLDCNLWTFECGPISFQEPYFMREVLAKRSSHLIL